MKIIKRNGSEETFDIAKIAAAIDKANRASDKIELNQTQIDDIADYI